LYAEKDIDPREYLGIGRGLAQVIDLTPTRENAKLAEARADRHAREQEHIEQMRQAKLEAQLNKIHNGIRDADRESIANKVKDYQALVYDNIEGVRNGDIKATLAVNEGIRSLNSTIDGSNDLANKEAFIDSRIEKEGGMGNHWNTDLWDNSKKTAYADKGNYGDYYGNVPLAKMDYQKDYRENVLPMTRHKGATTTVPTVNQYGQTVNTITTEIDPTDLKAIHSSRVMDSKIHLQLQKELAANPELKASFTDKDGNVDYVGLYETKITPELATQSIKIAQPRAQTKAQIDIATGKDIVNDISYTPTPNGYNISVPITTKGKNQTVQLVGANGMPLAEKQYVTPVGDITFEHKKKDGKPYVEAKGYYLDEHNTKDYADVEKAIQEFNDPDNLDKFYDADKFAKIEALEKQKKALETRKKYGKFDFKDAEKIPSSMGITPEDLDEAGLSNGKETFVTKNRTRINVHKGDDKSKPSATPAGKNDFSKYGGVKRTK